MGLNNGHVGNLGPVADGAGLVRIQIRDLDHTVIGNPAHDLIRLALSLASTARGASLPGITTVQMLEAIIDGYESAFDHDFDESADNVDHFSVWDINGVRCGALICYEYRFPEL